MTKNIDLLTHYTIPTDDLRKTQKTRITIYIHTHMTSYN